jgi:putative GTP pyrophosphokinase
MSANPIQPAEAAITAALGVYRDMHHELDLFMNTVGDWFSKHPKCISGAPPLVHSVKRRLKDPGHLFEKLDRKYVRDGQLTFNPDELGANVTDLSGVRVMHLYQVQFAEIHRLLIEKINSGDWSLNEAPKAYTWDPESRLFFESLGLECEIRDTYYTSVHYVVRPREGSLLNCEIQIRTLFEEIWGEVDHALNYPIPTEVVARKEQLRVLSKLVGAGSRLVDSIFRV